ncbi:zinc-dependent alcohol dehydrogenase family protein [Halioxenophilus aromaticivorans]|uniref:NAD(P)-dependent alcohol dehydrogenase n=1 Tax=Halioxenophilus aromaticivorans TaxID=1306992 RepID=A0AAV3U405_9ALTE
MKIFRTFEFTGVESLFVDEVSNPGPLARGQVRVAMRAASVNYRDLLAVTGQLGKFPEGLIPCSDGAGEIIEMAPDVGSLDARVKLGDKVALTYNPHWIGGPWRPELGAKARGGPLPGTMQREMVVHHSELVKLPSHLSFVEGACLPVAAVTAWHALCGSAALLPGTTVLVQGGGGVATFVVQLAKLFGARVIAMSSTDERCRRLKKLGADGVINYSLHTNWQEEVKRLTGGVGVDLTVELGGAKTLDKALASTRLGGRLALVGLITGWPNQTESLFSSSVDITPIRVGSRDDFEALNRALEFHRVVPVIDSTFAFDELPKALEYLKTGRQFGKIAIEF